MGKTRVILDISALAQANIEADVCIAGAGPAGIVLALELARQRPDWRVLLLEAGGREVANERERALYRVDMPDLSYAVDASRRRQLGGTSAHWGGWSKPLDATDFTVPKDWPVPGWPFGPEELTPFMPAAHRWCEIASDDYDPDSLRERQPNWMLEWPEDSAVTQHLFRFSPPTRFGTRYAADLEQQENLTCLLHANLFALEQQGDRIVSAQIRALDGTPKTVKAKHFVLALGGMETTRMLLNLRGDASADGEGIRSPHLGRWFADHYGLRPGILLAPAELQYIRSSDGGLPVMPVIAPSASSLADGRFQNSCLILQPVSTSDDVLPGYGGNTSLGFVPGDYWNYQVQMIIEPRPHPDSRLTLVDERCELGLKRLKLEWRQDDRDMELGLAFFDEVGSTLAQMGLGRARRVHPELAQLRANTSGSNHHLGSTRFANDPKDGVADSQGRVFGLDNLHLASSSLFPRYGYSNPTLTLVALSVRLAGHLSGKGATA